MTGHNYPDNLYADALARDEKPLGAYRSTDPVTKPAHYQRAGIETIDYIRATLDGPGFEAYCIGNVLKYVSRYREKGGIEDLRKAQVYLVWAIAPPEKREAYGMACESGRINLDCVMLTKGSNSAVHLSINRLPEWAQDVNRADSEHVERIPKWHPDYPKSPQPMQSEVIRDHDERLAGGEDKL